MKPGRIPCVVPFCRRTAARDPEDDDGQEVICGKHYRPVNPRLRRLLARNRRRIQRLAVCEENLPRYRLLMRLENHLWNKIKHQAIERAAGIG